MKVIIFGARGMLGRYAWMVLNNHYNVIPICRPDYDITRLHELNSFLTSLNLETGDVIINCAGIINKRIIEVGIKETIIVNSLFPNILSRYCAERELKFIHISTDFVFSGTRGNYSEIDVPDAVDEYGITKIIGEPDTATVIRASFVGEEVGSRWSLLEWVKAQTGTIRGYTDQWWNGITCLQLSEIFLEIIQKNLFWKGICHIHSSESINKYQLITYISEVYDKDIKVEPCNAGFSNRSLTSIYKKLFKIPEIRDQLVEMKKRSLIMKAYL